MKLRYMNVYLYIADQSGPKNFLFINDQNELPLMWDPV